MITIVHKIRLHRGASADAFEAWVREHDYATCPDLASLVAFQVHRVSRAPDAPFHYFEVITITSREAFERDMATPAFAKLVARFETMASVTEELTGDAIPPGFRR
jgi:hypothetical protein